jgi:hypothetical protein
MAFSILENLSYWIMKWWFWCETLIIRFLEFFKEELEAI